MLKMRTEPAQREFHSRIYERRIFLESELIEEVDRAAAIMVEMWERWGREEFNRREKDRCPPSDG